LAAVVSPVAIRSDANLLTAIASGATPSIMPERPEPVRVESEPPGRADLEGMLLWVQAREEFPREEQWAGPR
jgi:hypothetical protein